MGLINADKLMEKYTHPNELIYTFSVMDDIKNAPIVDAVPVVRCEDCKYGFPCVSLETETSIHCKLMRTIMRNDSFCSYGKRKEKDFTR